MFRETSDRQKVNHLKIPPHWRLGAGLPVLFLLFTVFSLSSQGCAPQTVPSEVVQASKSVVSYRYDLSRPLQMPVAVRVLPFLESLSFQEWPSSLTYMVARGTIPLDEIQFTDYFNNVFVLTRLIRVTGKALYFASITRGGDNRPALYKIVCIPIEKEPKEIAPVAEAKVMARMHFDVREFKNRIVLIFPTISGIHQTIGYYEGDRIHFEPPTLIQSVDGAVHDLLVARSANALHLVWVDQQGNLRAARTEDPEDGWQTPLLISSTAQPYSPINIVAKDDTVYLGWSDFRFRRGAGTFWSRYWVNDYKLMLARSSDGGRSYSKAVLVNDKGDKDDIANQTFLTLSGEYPIAMWRGERYIENLRWNETPWRRAVLTPNLRGHESLDHVPHKVFIDEYQRAMTVFVRQNIFLDGTASMPDIHHIRRVAPYPYGLRPPPR